MNMKQTFFIMALALGMCSINGSAQTNKSVMKATASVPKDSREYQVGNDGFEWYKVCKNGKWGAEDRNGNVLVPMEYNGISYDAFNYNEILTTANGPGFKAYKDAYISYYLKTGKCIIPYTRKYTSILKYYHHEQFGTIYICRKENGCAVCDISGREILSNSNYSEATPNIDFGKFYYTISKAGYYGIADGNGNIIVSPQYRNVIVPNKEKAFVTKNDNTGEYEIVGFLSSITTCQNPFESNPREDPDKQSLSTIQIGSNVGGNKNDSPSSGSQTQTIVVEHHHDPVPVQQWQACFACGGMGTMGCDNCGGSGTKYIGDRLHRCSRCNGRGIIPCNVCYGNKGKYITVYQ